MFKKPSLPFLAFLQATGLVLYLGFIALFFNFTSTLDKFDNKNTAQFYAPIIMLLLFILSAVISASLVLGRAGMFFLG